MPNPEFICFTVLVLMEANLINSISIIEPFACRSVGERCELNQVRQTDFESIFDAFETLAKNENILSAVGNKWKRKKNWNCVMHQLSINYCKKIGYNIDI